MPDHFKTFEGIVLIPSNACLLPCDFYLLFNGIHTLRLGSSNPRLYPELTMTPYRITSNWLTSSTGSGSPRTSTLYTISSSSLSLTGLNLGSFVPALMAFWMISSAMQGQVGAMVPMHPRSCPCFSMIRIRPLFPPSSHGESLWLGYCFPVRT